MITVLLEKIIQILEGWIQSFSSHAQHVEDKLDSIDSTASDIETNTDPIPDIRDNTAAIITPIQNIKSNTDSIATSSQTSANNTTAILNNIGTLSTNTGRAAAFAEDCATNTLDIKDKTVTIASDTTQIRADSGNIRADVSEMKTYLEYYMANTPVTEDSEGDICNFDTDLEDYLQKAICTIPADLSGFSSIDINKVGKNLAKEVNTNTIYFTMDSDHVFTQINPSSAPFSWTYSNCIMQMQLPAGNYVLTIFAKTVSTNASANALVMDDSNNILATAGTMLNKNIETLSFTLTGTTNVGIGAKIYNGAFYFLLEYGNASSSYEPYKVMSDTISLGSTITDGAEIDLLSGLMKVNTTPPTYSQLTPIAIRTYKGVNNIYSDIGNMSITYRETLKHYLDKNNQ